MGSLPKPELIDPDTWIDEYYFLNQPGQADIQLELFYDYQNNVKSYPTSAEPSPIADATPFHRTRANIANSEDAGHRSLTVLTTLPTLLTRRPVPLKACCTALITAAAPASVRQIAEGHRGPAAACLHVAADSTGARFVSTMNDDLSAFSGEPLCDRLVDAGLLPVTNDVYLLVAGP